jgi:DNA-binding YbaB/EbfC family protein
MLQQLQSLQAEMAKAQEEVASMVVTSTAGGGAVTAAITGEKRVQSITIDPDVVDPEDVEMLQDLVVAAVNSGLEQIDEAMTEKMQPFTGGLDIPGM